MSRGASRAVVRALSGDEPSRVGDEVDCPRCGFPIDFGEIDPLGVGRTMQRCTNRHCPDRMLRPVPRRRV